MGGAPSYELIRSLAILSVVALSITSVLIFTAIKTFSGLKKKRELRHPGRNSTSFGLWWGLLVVAVLDHLDRIMRYPMRVLESENLSAKKISAAVLGAPFAVILSPVFVATWLIQLIVLNLSDMYRLLSKYLIPA